MDRVIDVDSILYDLDDMFDGLQSTENPRVVDPAADRGANEASAEAEYKLFWKNDAQQTWTFVFERGVANNDLVTEGSGAVLELQHSGVRLSAEEQPQRQGLDMEHVALTFYVPVLRLFEQTEPSTGDCWIKLAERRLLLRARSGDTNTNEGEIRSASTPAGRNRSRNTSASTSASAGANTSSNTSTNASTNTNAVANTNANVNTNESRRRNTNTSTNTNRRRNTTNPGSTTADGGSANSSTNSSAGRGVNVNRNAATSSANSDANTGASTNTNTNRRRNTTNPRITSADGGAANGNTNSSAGRDANANRNTTTSSAGSDASTGATTVTLTVAFGAGQSQQPAAGPVLHEAREGTSPPEERLADDGNSRRSRKRKRKEETATDETRAPNCILCENNARNCVLTTCGHMYSCLPCMHKYIQHCAQRHVSIQCSVCKEPFSPHKNILQVYL